MRGSVLILPLLMFLPLSASALRWSETQWDFGTVREIDGRVEHEFRFYNDGADTVTVTSTRSSCGCTTADYTRGAVAPGDSGMVRVVYDPSYRPGRFTKHVEVRLGGQRERLAVSGTVHPAGETVGRLFPESVGPLRVAKKTAVAGDVKQGRHRTVSYILYNASRDTLRVAASADDNRVRLTLDGDCVAPSELVTLSVAVRAKKMDETGRFEVPVRLTAGEKTYDGLTIVGQVVAADPAKVDYSKAPRLKVATDRLDFTGAGGGRVTRHLTVENAGGAELRVDNAVTYCDGVTVKKYPKKLKPGKRGEVVVEVDPSKFDGDVLNTSITLLTNDPSVSDCRIRLVGDFSRRKKDN